jgi:solute carrier family 35, member C2
MIVVMISSGLLLFTYKSTEFDTLGFILLLIASVSSGARWTLAQLLMQKSKLGLHNPIGEWLTRPQLAVNTRLTPLASQI